MTATDARSRAAHRDAGAVESTAAGSGIPTGRTVFHEGTWLTVITTDDQIVAVDRRSGRTRWRYRSLNEW